MVGVRAAELDLELRVDARFQIDARNLHATLNQGLGDALCVQGQLGFLSVLLAKGHSVVGEPVDVGERALLEGNDVAKADGCTGFPHGAISENRSQSLVVFRR